jgi:hypothetical protein
MATAQAQSPGDWTIDPSILLTGTDVPYGETIGSPTVVYNTRDSQYYMFFETRLSATDPECPAGLWGIGTATSADGLSWTVRNNITIAPAPNAATPTFHSCVAAHPGAIYRETPQGGIIEVFFKGEQADDACVVLDPDPSWGCGQYTGVGRYRIRFNTAGQFVDETLFADPVLERAANFGYPKPMRVTNTGGQTTWLLSYGVYPNIELATATSAAGPWTEQGVILDAASSTAQSAQWIEDEFFGSALACRDAGILPFESFVGGRDTNFGVVQTGGIGKAISSNGQPNSWTLGLTAQFDILSDDEFRHWDLLRIGTSDYTLWFDEKDGSGNNQIRVASTIPTFTWNNADVYDKQCDQ